MPVLLAVFLWCRHTKREQKDIYKYRGKAVNRKGDQTTGKEQIELDTIRPKEL